MTHTLDIFSLDSHGVLWLESAATLEDARARIQELGAQSAEYLVIDQKTGKKYIFKLDGGEKGSDARPEITE
jgi:hypothetical protein